MQTTQIIIVISLTVAAIANALMGAMVYLGDRTSYVHRYFASFAAAVSLWVVTNALYVIVESELRLPVALASYVSAMLLAMALLFFSLSYTKTAVKPFLKRMFVVLGLAACIYSGWPGVVATEVTDDLIIITNQSALLVYGAALLFFFAASVTVLVKSYISSIGIDRERIRLIVFGLSGAMVLGVFFNLILPLFGIYDYVQLGPVATLILVGASAFAIIYHGLFDIKVVVARLLSYIFAVLLIAGLYVVVVFNFVSLLFPEGSVTSGEGLLYTLFAVGAAITFQPIKNFFDKVTDRVFFRGSYDLRTTLDEIGHIIVTSRDMDQLLSKSMNVLSEALRPTYVMVILKEENVKKQQYVVGEKIEVGSEVVDLLAHKVGTLLLLDSKDGVNMKLKDAMSAIDARVVAPLKTSQGSLGILIIGGKRSGDAYNPKDSNLLSVSVDEIAIGVQNALRFEEIQNFNETLQEKVDSATHRLQRANARLRQLDATKDEFVSMASHQLRTPLTSIKGYLSMVLEGDAGKLNPTQEKLLHEAFTSSERMVRLIGDFLNVSRLRTGRFVLEKGKVNLADLVEGEVAQLESSATTRGLKLIYEKPENFPIMDLDKNKIQQVVMNFIDNALFYSKSGGKVRIELLKKQNEVILKVKDSGIGVPAHEKRRIFTKFYRASNARKQRPDGTGIGLFMAQKVIVAHGGSVIFESTEGKGSTFGFHLPIVLSKEEAAKAAAEVEKAITE